MYIDQLTFLREISLILSRRNVRSFERLPRPQKTGSCNFLPNLALRCSRECRSLRTRSTDICCRNERERARARERERTRYYKAHLYSWEPTIWSTSETAAMAEGLREYRGTSEVGAVLRHDITCTRQP